VTNKNRQQILGIVAGLALLLFVGDKMVFTPLVKSWKARSERIAGLKQSIAQGALLLEREQTIRRRWDSMRTNTLPEEVSAAENEVLQAFERWSQDSHISISGIKPQWKQAGDDYVTLECHADAFGTMEALTRFLYQVEKDPLALKLESVEITAKDNDGQQLALGLQVSGLRLSAQE